MELTDILEEAAMACMLVKMNTSIIVATQIGDNQTESFAAKTCADYTVIDGAVTYGDWYLPSIYELNLLYLQKDVIGGLSWPLLLEFY